MAAVVVEEVALVEFERWAGIFEIDLSEDGLTDEDIESIAAFRRKFVRRIMSGQLTVDDEGTLEYSPRGSKDDPLRFEEPIGTILSARKKGDSDAMAARRTLGQWAGVPPKQFSDMKMRDVNFCAELLGFFSTS